MKNKIKINNPHFYFKVRRFFTKNANNAETLFLFLVIMTALMLVVRAFIEGDAIIRLAMTAVFFAFTTFSLLFYVTVRREKV